MPSRVKSTLTLSTTRRARKFYLQQGKKAGLVRLGTKPVLNPIELKACDLIRIGKTTLRFIPCCGPEFSWSDEIIVYA